MNIFSNKKIGAPWEYFIPRLADKTSDNISLNILYIFFK